MTKAQRSTLEIDQGTARITVERILRDSDDDGGQSVRDWKIEAECSHVTVRMRNGDGFLLMRPDDIDTFVADLYRAQEAARSLAKAHA